MKFSRTYKEKIKKMLLYLKKKLVWNGVIRANTIAYINYCIYFGAEIEQWLRHGHKMTGTPKVLAAVCFCMIILTPLVSVYILERNRPYLHQLEVREKISMLYMGIKTLYP
jgi:hypothetical protein